MSSKNTITVDASALCAVLDALHGHNSPKRIRDLILKRVLAKAEGDLAGTDPISVLWRQYVEQTVVNPTHQHQRT